ncbi:latent-transforming growth factor beta-binding protein 4-like [Anarrhichthys ocellatus]|uniref:latent-transforming growth factor beta-binding protein 4-like n=1 Tax=Anarrhichthys ocellatus TaxID=433405 RepID=UPI0012EEB44B|nr:latent-transforming growth factor beta-binding protein 4-like [Anarrhichthys ocellatus]
MMTHLGILLSALLLVLVLVLSVSEPLSSPEENEVLKHTETELTKSQVTENVIGNLSETTLSPIPTTAPSTTTDFPSPVLAPQRLGNQVMLENSAGCGCPSGMVKDGDNCACPVGLTLEGAAGCEDVDECEAEGPGPCGPHASCTNSPGSYSCSCLRGYLMGAGGCQDIDECALAAVTGLQACQGDAECRNTPGSFTCSCPSGYVMALNGKSCADVDECSFEELCRRELGNVCVNTPGSFVCQCQPGFRAAAPACVDVDECTESPAVCGGQGVCENTLGSYKCVCRPGYQGNGTHCEGKRGQLTCVRVF